ncbi:MAG: citrate synthase [Pigmentiphaga sp.]|nr:citrate synthase [Pigmentiphaga sp.]
MASPTTANKEYLTAAEAMAVLKVRQQTLYAYVSRGLIRSVKQPDSKGKLYLAEDVNRTRSRSQARAGHGAVAASAMNWGEPIIPTSITEITAEGPSYRGRLATQLAQAEASFESVAELLWTGIWHQPCEPWRVPVPESDIAALKAFIGNDGGHALLDVFAVAVLHLGLRRGSIEDRVRSGHILNAARQVLRTLVGALGWLGPGRTYHPLDAGERISSGVLRALAVPHTDENQAAIEAMLVLFADHELSPGTLAARVAASSGAPLHGCLAAAICATAGVQVARLYDRVESFLDANRTLEALRRSAGQAQRQGSAPPGFGHPLYPHGDPRAGWLLKLAQQRRRQSRRLEAIYTFLHDMEHDLGLHPRHELTAATLAIAMELPPRTLGPVFALSRCAGWVAHVQEQRLSPAMLRPRARFVT